MNPPLYESPSLPFFRPTPSAEVRLFFIPPVTFRAALFQAWQRLLPRTIALCAVELPGRGTRALEAPITDRESFVRGLSEEILPRLDRDFAIAGWCSGSLLAYALAQHLEHHHGRRAKRLFIGTSTSPAHPLDPARLSSEADVLAWAREVTESPLPELEDREFREMMTSMVLADQALFIDCHAKAEPPVSAPITAFYATRDSSVSRAHVASWERATTAEFRLLPVEGTHMSFTEPAARDRLVETYAADLL